MSINLPKRMIKTILNAETRPLEIMIAIQSVLWGVWFIPPTNVATFSSIYATMAGIAPDWVWGVFSCSIGAAQIISAHINKGSLRKWAATVTLCFWTFIDLTFWISKYRLIDSVLYMVVVIMGVWSIVSLSTKVKNHRG